MYIIPKGSMVVLASASHLSATGPDGYAAKTAVELDQIRKRFRGVVVLQQIAPIRLGGCDAPVLPRTTINLCAWFKAIRIYPLVC
jgi:hypothetical protein